MAPTTIVDRTSPRRYDTMAMTSNYVNGMELVADTLAKAGRFDEAVTIVKQAIALVPYVDDAHAYLSQVYAQAGRDGLILELIAKATPGQAPHIYLGWAVGKKFAGDRAKAKEILQKTLDLFPRFSDAFREYALLLYEDKEMDKLQALVRTWLYSNPTDDNAQRLQEEIRRLRSTDRKDS